jgi:hypothetical protein
MFINISNHPASKWGDKQINHAYSIGRCEEIVDIPFPNVDPTYTRNIVEDIADSLIKKLPLDKMPIIHIMGEMTLTYNVIKRIKEIDSCILIVASTTERNVVERDGKKIVEFNFIQFRAY